MVLLRSVYCALVTVLSCNAYVSLLLCIVWQLFHVVFCFFFLSLFYLTSPVHKRKDRNPREANPIKKHRPASKVRVCILIACFGKMTTVLCGTTFSQTSICGNSDNLSCQIIPVIGRVTRKFFFNSTPDRGGMTQVALNNILIFCCRFCVLLYASPSRKDWS